MEPESDMNTRSVQKVFELKIILYCVGYPRFLENVGFGEMRFKKL